MCRAAGAVLALALLAAPGCRRSEAPRAGERIVLHYELSADGAVVESTFGGIPVEIVLGSGDVPPGVDRALGGMVPGEEKRVELSSGGAFGPRDPARVQELPLADFGAMAEGLKPGVKVQGFRDGKPETGLVMSVGGGKAVLDFNHPLAGKAVTYRLKIVSRG